MEFKDKKEKAWEKYKNELASSGGEPKEIADNLRVAESRMVDNKKLLKDAVSNNQNLFSSQGLAWNILGKYLEKGYDRLNKLKEAGIIPFETITVLNQRIEQKECFCGSDLSEGTEARGKIDHLIQNSEQPDNAVRELSSLANSADQSRAIAIEEQKEENWKKKKNDLYEERTRLISDIGDKQKGLIKEIDDLKTKANKIKNSMLQEYENAHTTADKHYQEAKDRNSEFKIKRDLENNKEDDLTSTVNILKRKQGTKSSVESRLEIAKDLQDVVENTLKVLKEDCLSEVSTKMEQIFKSVNSGELTGSGNSLVQSAEIKNYEMCIRTHENVPVDIDAEVNGAATRVATFAFIWALCEVSQVPAPRFLDTPLGVISGGVKFRAMENFSKSKPGVDSQVILFMTRAEIRDIEDLIDKYAGVITTITNSDHYPNDLVYDPSYKFPTVIKCSCDHRSSCKFCERKTDKNMLVKTRGKK